MKRFFSILCLLGMVSCNSRDNKNAAGDSVVLNYENISPERKTVNPNPVKKYEETIKSFETTDQFKVSLYETKETFHYLIKVQYKNLDEEDTLKVPNFGIRPAVEIVKGDSIRPSCIIGFYDEKKQFRESKLVYFEDNTLKVHVLKHYAVATYQSPVK
jgi:hypothetical protein